MQATCTSRPLSKRCWNRNQLVALWGPVTAQPRLVAAAALPPWVRTHLAPALRRRARLEQQERDNDSEDDEEDDEELGAAVGGPAGDHRRRRGTSTPDMPCTSLTHAVIADDLMALIDVKRSRIVWIVGVGGPESEPRNQKVLRLLRATHAQLVWIASNEKMAQQDLAEDIMRAMPCDAWELNTSQGSFHPLQLTMMQDGLPPLPQDGLTVPLRRLIALGPDVPASADLRLRKPSEDHLAFNYMREKRLKAQRRKNMGKAGGRRPLGQAGSSVRRSSAKLQDWLRSRLGHTAVGLTPRIMLTKNRITELVWQEATGILPPALGASGRALGFLPPLDGASPMERDAQAGPLPDEAFRGHEVVEAGDPDAPASLPPSASRPAPPGGADDEGLREWLATLPEVDQELFAAQLAKLGRPGELYTGAVVISEDEEDAPQQGHDGDGTESETDASEAATAAAGASVGQGADLATPASPPQPWDSVYASPSPDAQRGGKEVPSDGDTSPAADLETFVQGLSDSLGVPLVSTDDVDDAAMRAGGPLDGYNCQVSLGPGGDDWALLLRLEEDPGGPGRGRDPKGFGRPPDRLHLQRCLQVDPAEMEGDEAAARVSALHAAWAASPNAPAPDQGQRAASPGPTAAPDPPSPQATASVSDAAPIPSNPPTASTSSVGGEGTRPSSSATDSAQAAGHSDDDWLDVARALLGREDVSAQEAEELGRAVREAASGFDLSGEELAGVVAGVAESGVQPSGTARNVDAASPAQPTPANDAGLPTGQHPHPRGGEKQGGGHSGVPGAAQQAQQHQHQSPSGGDRGAAQDGRPGPPSAPTSVTVSDIVAGVKRAMDARFGDRAGTPPRPPRRLLPGDKTPTGRRGPRGGGQRPPHTDSKRERAAAMAGRPNGVMRRGLKGRQGRTSASRSASPPPAPTRGSQHVRGVPRTTRARELKLRAASLVKEVGRVWGSVSAPHPGMQRPAGLPIYDAMCTLARLLEVIQRPCDGRTSFVGRDVVIAVPLEAAEGPTPTTDHDVPTTRLLVTPDGVIEMGKDRDGAADSNVPAGVLTQEETDVISSHPLEDVTAWLDGASRGNDSDTNEDDSDGDGDGGELAEHMARMARPSRFRYSGGVTSASHDADDEDASDEGDCQEGGEDGQEGGEDSDSDGEGLDANALMTRLLHDLGATRASRGDASDGSEGGDRDGVDSDDEDGPGIDDILAAAPSLPMLLNQGSDSEEEGEGEGEDEGSDLAHLLRRLGLVDDAPGSRDVVAPGEVNEGGSEDSELRAQIRQPHVSAVLEHLVLAGVLGAEEAEEGDEGEEEGDDLVSIGRLLHDLAGLWVQWEDAAMAPGVEGVHINLKTSSGRA